jgi:acetyltransferase-like isoleucine patch superfamily enzyme
MNDISIRTGTLIQQFVFFGQNVIIAKNVRLSANRILHQGA